MSNANPPKPSRAIDEGSGTSVKLKYGAKLPSGPVNTLVAVAVASLVAVRNWPVLVTIGRQNERHILAATVALDVRR